MKQHISKAQWKELSDEEYKKFRPLIGIASVRRDIPFYEYITIGRMIEFLGEGNSSEMLFTSYGRVCIEHDWYEGCNNCQTDKNQELADALWEAVKLKLKN